MLIASFLIFIFNIILFYFTSFLGIQFEKDVAPCDVLIYFDVPDEIMTERLIKRGETSGRIDDNEETISKRLVTFHEQTTPILGYYGKQGKLITIDANRKADEVFGDVSQALERLMEQQQVGKQRECFLSFFLHMFFVLLFVCDVNTMKKTFFRSFFLFAD
jgi:hypothetical protein